MPLTFTNHQSCAVSECLTVQSFNFFPKCFVVVGYCHYSRYLHALFEKFSIARASLRCFAFRNCTWQRQTSEKSYSTLARRPVASHRICSASNMQITLAAENPAMRLLGGTSLPISNEMFYAAKILLRCCGRITDEVISQFAVVCAQSAGTSPEERHSSSALKSVHRHTLKD